MLHTDDKNCPRYALAKKYTKASDEYSIISDYFVTNYKVKFEKLIGQKVKDGEMMNSMCSYIQWAQINNITLKFTPTAEDNAYCLAFGDSKLYHVSYGLADLWKLSSTDFIKEVFHYGDMLRIQTSFNKPFL